MAKIGRSTVTFAAVGILALVALAAFLVLDLAGGSVDPSSLPLIQISQPGTGGDQSPAQSTQDSGSGQPDGTASTTVPGFTTTRPAQTTGGSTTTSAAGTTTGSTVRETINGAVHTGTSTSPAGTGGLRNGSGTTSSGSGGAASTNTTGGR